MPAHQAPAPHLAKDPPRRRRDTIAAGDLLWRKSGTDSYTVQTAEALNR